MFPFHSIVCHLLSGTADLEINQALSGRNSMERMFNGVCGRHSWLLYLLSKRSWKEAVHSLPCSWQTHVTHFGQWNFSQKFARSFWADFVFLIKRTERMAPVLSFPLMMLKALRALFQSAMQCLTHKKSQWLLASEKHKEKARESQINLTFLFFYFFAKLVTAYLRKINFCFSHFFSVACNKSVLNWFTIVPGNSLWRNK